MNDHDAIDAINAALNRYFHGDVTGGELVNEIAFITGANKNEHEASK